MLVLCMYRASQKKVGFRISNSPVVWDDQRLTKLTDTAQQLPPPSPRAQVEFQCDKCDDAFNREFFLARHKKDVHNVWRLFTGLHWNRKPGRAALPELRL